MHCHKNRHADPKEDHALLSKILVVDTIEDRLFPPRKDTLMLFDQLMHDSNRNSSRVADLAVQFAIDIRTVRIAGGFRRPHLAVLIATISAVAIRMDGPIFGQSIFHCVPTCFID